MDFQSQVTPRQRFWMITGVATFGVFLFGFAGYKAYEQHQQHDRMRAAFRPYLSEYLSMPKPRAGEARLSARIGKMVLVDVEEADLDEMHFFTHDTAETPEEVETVVWLKWGTDRVAMYEGGGWACRWLCTASVFDRKERGLIAQKDFRGGDPPSVTTTPSGSSDYGSKPEGEIRAWLAGLRGK